MNSKEFEQVVNEQLDRCKDILCKKAEEYATDDDRLHNFKAAAGLTGETPAQALFGMWLKHLVSISDMCKSGKDYDIDLWNEKITDCINYALLCKALVLDNQPKSTERTGDFIFDSEQDAKEFIRRLQHLAEVYDDVAVIDAKDIVCDIYGHPRSEKYSDEDLRYRWILDDLYAIRPFETESHRWLVSLPKPALL